MSSVIDPRAFYEHIWTLDKSGTCPAKHRDPIHRYLLDPIFEPRANRRYFVAMSLLNPTTRLLDIGCWDGYFLQLLRDHGISGDLLGIDILPEAVISTCAKGFWAEQIDLNSQPLPFPDAHFDAVTMLAVLEHLFDPYSVIREVRRILRPRGQLIIDVPNVASFTNRLRILCGRLPVTSGDPGWDGGHLHYFTKHALDRFLISEGFAIRIRRTTGGRPYLREKWLSLLGGELLYSCERLP